MHNNNTKLDNTILNSDQDGTNLTKRIGLVICITIFITLLIVSRINLIIALLCAAASFFSFFGYYLLTKKKKHTLGIKLSVISSFVCLSLIHYVVQDSENIHIILWYIIAAFGTNILINKKWGAIFLAICLFNTILIGLLNQNDVHLFGFHYFDSFDTNKKDVFYYLRLVIPFLTIYYLINNYINHKDKNENEILSLLDQKNVLNQQLSSSQLKYRNLVEEVDDLIYQVNHLGQLVYANQTTIQKTGYTKAELLSFDYLKLVHEESRIEHIRFFAQQANNLLKVSYKEFPILTKNGDTIWLGQKTSMFFEENGQMQGSMCIARDITEERVTKRELIRAKEKAIEATKIKAQFLSSMSHEIRTPMNAVIALTHLLLEEDPKDNQKEHLQTLKFSAENLLQLINDILDFSKIEAGKVTFRETAFNLKRVLRTIQHGLGSKAKEKGIQLHLNFDEATPNMVLGDPLRLTQVLNNLVGNAIKFTHKGSVTVDVKTSLRHTNSTDIQFVIKDTGIGIPENQLSTIFNDFSQVNDTNIRQGTGLGLAITKNILELQNSHINVSSELNKGSVFKFKLNFKKYKNPLSALTIQPHTPDSVYPKNSLNRPLNRLQLLLVEDNKINQKVTLNFLKKWGIDVDIANNGQIAVDMVKAKNYQLILMDLQMPVMDGIEATKQIRKLGDYYAAVPIITLTASAITEVKEETSRVGFTDFIAKPFLPADLYEKINKHILLPNATSRS